MLITKRIISSFCMSFFFWNYFQGLRAYGVVVCRYQRSLECVTAMKHPGLKSWRSWNSWVMPQTSQFCWMLTPVMEISIMLVVWWRSLNREVLQGLVSRTSCSPRQTLCWMAESNLWLTLMSSVQRSKHAKVQLHFICEYRIYRGEN